MNTRSCPLGCLPSPALSPRSGSPAVPISWHLGRSPQITEVHQPAPRGTASLLPTPGLHLCGGPLPVRPPHQAAGLRLVPGTRPTKPGRQGEQTEERCFLPCLATTYHPHQDFYEGGRGSDSLESRHTPGLFRWRHGHPTDGPLLRPGPGPHS